MNIKELEKYCLRNKINLNIITKYKNLGISRANMIYEAIQKERTLLYDLGTLIDDAERLKNSYFWTPPYSASYRRYTEEKYSHEKIEWQENNNLFSAKLSVSCSCRNYYVNKSFYKNGKATNLTSIRNSYNRMYNAFYIVENENVSA